jgi:hypothetical protein
MSQRGHRRIIDRAKRSRISPQIAATPDAQHPNVTALVGAQGVIRVRQGGLASRVFVEDGNVIVDRVAHRREVYR